MPCMYATLVRHTLASMVMPSPPLLPVILSLGALLGRPVGRPEPDRPGLADAGRDPPMEPPKMPPPAPSLLLPNMTAI